MTKALDLITYARQLAPTIEYVHAGQGGDRDKDGLREADCVGFVNVVLDHFGIRVPLVGPTLPYKVRWCYDHWTGGRSVGLPPEPGDLLIIGDPTSTISDRKFRHIGIATVPGRYISSLGVIPGDDAKETAIPSAAHDRVVCVLRCGLTQETPMKVVTIIPLAPGETGSVAVQPGAWSALDPTTLIPGPAVKFTTVSGCAFDAFADIDGVRYLRITNGVFAGGYLPVGPDATPIALPTVTPAPPTVPLADLEAAQQSLTEAQQEYAAYRAFLAAWLAEAPPTEPDA